jgi:hypothetical protein
MLLGLAVGAVWEILILSRAPLQTLLGAHGVAAETANLRYFEGVWYVVGLLASITTFQAVFSAMWVVFTIVGLKRALRHMAAVAIAALALFTLIVTRELFTDAPGVLGVNLAIALTVSAIVIGLAIRVGLLATAVAFTASYLLAETPWTLDANSWHFAPAAAAFAVLAGLAVLGGWAARSGTPLRRA